MNNLWKRAASLMLSGVLLMSSVPVQVWATEEDPVDPVDPAALTQQEAEGDNELQLADNAPVDLPIAVNGTQITSDKAADILGDQSVAFVADDNKLVLNGAEAASVEFGDDLIICLEEDTVSTISGALCSMEYEGAEPTNLTIIGKGTLYVDTIATTGNLTIEDAVVVVGTDRPESEERNGQKTLIKVYNEITVAGTAHLATATGHKALAITDSAQMDETLTNETPQCKLTGEFYFRTDAAEDFEQKSDTSVGPVNTVDYLEVISLDHLDTEFTCDEDSHYKTCAAEDCVLRDSVVIDDTAHGEETEVKPAEEGEHQTVYTCCGYVIKTDTHDLKYIVSEDGASILALCEPCGANGSVTISATSREEDVQEENVKYTSEGILDGKEPAFSYYKLDEATGEEPVEVPEKIGKYRVYMTYGEKTVSAEFEITKPSIERATVTISGTYEYNGNAHNPASETITVKVGEQNLAPSEDYTISYGENIQAGKGTVTITGVEGSRYGGSKTIEFDITPKTLTEGDLELAAAELTYNGQNQIPGFKESALKLNEDYTVTQPENSTDVGQYKLKVTGKGNYQGTVELPYSIVKTGDYTDATRKEQRSGKNVGNLELPKFTGINGEEVKGTCTYKFTYKGETAEIAASSIQEKINNQMQPGETATLAYVFTPAENSNYTGTKTDSIEITRVDLTFELEDGTKATADNVKKTGNITYGDTDIINTNLIAKVNGVPGNKGEGFTVKFAKDGASEENKTDAPVVGSNKFWIYYSGTIGDHTFADVLVCEGWITVNSRSWNAEDLVKPNREVLAEKADGTALALLTEANKGSIGEDTEALEYRLGTTGSWSKEIPTATEAGFYEVYYRPSANYAPQTEGKVQILVTPYLTATYGDKLEDLDLPTGFSFNATAHPKLDVAVGNAGNQKVKLDYTHPNDNANVPDDYPTLTDHEVTLKVNPAKIKVNVTLVDKHLPYNAGNKVEASVTVRAEGADTDLPVTEYSTVCTNITNTADTEVKNPGMAQIKVVPKGNYVFDNTEAELTKEYVVYREGKTALGDSEDAVPPDLEGVYETGKKIKEKLDEKIDDSYPAARRNYIKYVMLDKEGKTALYDDLYWPEDGILKTWKYTTGYTKDDNYQICGMYIVGENAGEIFEMKEITSGSPSFEEFYVGADGIVFGLENYAIVCIAADVDLTKEYTITKSIVLDSKSSTQGTLTIKVDDKTATKATYGKTVEITATAKSGYSIASVTVTDAGGNKVALEQDGSNYEFSMPASNVTVKLSLKKTTSSTKNANTGDSSNIQLWTTILAASGIGVVAALFFWLRKRKK